MQGQRLSVDKILQFFDKKRRHFTEMAGKSFLLFWLEMPSFIKL